LAITTAEAILRETLFVSTATTARQKVGTESDQAKAIADAELARAHALADALHALQTALNADWVPIEWNGWGYGGWGYGWGGWYGGYGGWGYGWGGWYGWGGYVFGYAAYGWGGYGYGGFGGWNGFGWGFGTWYGGWGFGWGYGWGYGGNYGGNSGAQEDYDDEVDEIEDDYNDALDSANDTAKDELAAAKLAEAIRNGDAGIAFATSRGNAGVAYVIAQNIADDAYSTVAQSQANTLNLTVGNAERTWDIAVSTAKKNRVFAENAATVTLATEKASTTSSYLQGIAQSESVFHHANSVQNHLRAQQNPIGPRGEYQRAYAEANSTWIANAAPAFVSSKSIEANATALLAVEIAKANAVKSNTMANSEHDRVTANTLTNETYVLANTQASNSMSTGLRTIENQRSATHANNAKAFDVSVATNAKARQVAIAQALVDFEEDSDEYQNAIKNARKQGAIQFSTLSHDFSTAEHASRKVYSFEESNIRHAYAVAGHSIEESKTVSLSSAKQAKRVSDANANKVYWDTESAQRRMATISHDNAKAAFYTATETAIGIANNLIHTRMQLPWTQYLVSAAQVRQNAWSASSLVYGQLVVQRANVEQTYDSSVSQARLDTTIASVVADHSAMVMSSAATKSSEISNANARKTFEQQMSTTTQVYLDRLSEIKKDESIEQQNNPNGPASDWQAQRTSATNTYVLNRAQKQSSARTTFDANSSAEDSAFTTANAAKARTMVDADATYRSVEANAYSVVIADLRNAERLYTIAEFAAIVSASSSFSTSSPWAAYDALEAIARAAWKTTVGNVISSKDAQVAQGQRQLELAVTNADDTYENRRIDYVSSIQLETASLPGVYGNGSMPLPTLSQAPFLDEFYASIASGTIPSEVGTRFIPTSTNTFSNSSGYSGGLSGGYRSSILNPDGFREVGYEGSGNGGGFGDFSVIGGSPSSRVNWNLIGEADSIQSTQATDIAITLYGLSSGLKTIFDSEEPDNFGNGGSGYGGEGEPPIVFDGPLTMDFASTSTISEIIGERSPELQRLFEATASARYSSLPMRPGATYSPILSSPSVLGNSQDRTKTKPTISLFRNNAFSMDARASAIESAQSFEQSLNVQLQNTPNLVLLESAFTEAEPEEILSESEANAIVEFENMIATLSQKLAGMKELSTSDMSTFDQAGLTVVDNGFWPWESVLKVVRIGDSNYAYVFHDATTYHSRSGFSDRTVSARWELHSVNNSSERMDKQIFALIRDQGYLSALQTTEVLLSIVPGGSTATYIEDGKFIRAGLAFGSDVVQTVFPLGKLAKLQKLASVTSKVTKVSNVAISAKTMASAMLIVDSLNAGVGIHDTVQDVQKGNKVGAAIGSLDVLFSVLNVGFSAKQLADAARDARRVVDGSMPEVDTAKPGLKKVEPDSIDDAIESLKKTSSRSFVTDYTYPTGLRNGIPAGRRSTNLQNADSEFKRGIARENQSADILAGKGYKVEQNPNVPLQSTNPDFRIEGKLFDNYAPTSGDVRSIMREINRKAAFQARRVVLNLADSPITRHELRKGIDDYASTDVLEIIVIDKLGNIVKFFP
jgi:hypothetical protein